MSRESFPVSAVVGEVVEAPLLLNPRTFSPRYDLDRVAGTFSREGHPLRDQALAGRILASPGVQGGVAGGWAFLAMRDLGVGPAALLFGRVNPVMVQGAVTAGLTIAAGLDESFWELACTGDVIRIDSGRREVVLERRVSR